MIWQQGRAICWGLPAACPSGVPPWHFNPPRLLSLHCIPGPCLPARFFPFPELLAGLLAQEPFLRSPFLRGLATGGCGAGGRVRGPGPACCLLPAPGGWSAAGWQQAGHREGKCSCLPGRAKEQLRGKSEAAVFATGKLAAAGSSSQEEN